MNACTNKALEMGLGVGDEIVTFSRVGKKIAYGNFRITQIQPDVRGYWLKKDGSHNGRAYVLPLDWYIVTIAYQKPQDRVDPEYGVVNLYPLF